MDRLVNLEVVLQGFGKVAASKNWSAAERLSERIKGVILDAAMADDRQALRDMRSRLLAFATSYKLKGDGTDPAAIFLRNDAALAAVAVRLRPTGVKPTSDQALRKASDRVLHYLATRGSGAGTNDIAKETAMTRETASRALTELKAQGLITSRRLGRNVVSRLTLRGRRAAGESFNRPMREVRREFSPRPLPRISLANVFRTVRLESSHELRAVEDIVQRQLAERFFVAADGDGRSKMSDHQIPVNGIMAEAA